MLQDVRIGLPVQLTLQPLPVLLISFAAALVPRALDPHTRQVALHITVGAAAPRSRQADAIVHGSAEEKRGAEPNFIPNLQIPVKENLSFLSVCRTELPHTSATTCILIK